MMEILHTVDNHYAIADLWKKSEKAAALAAEKEITHMNTKVIEVRSFTIDDHKMVEDRITRISLPKKVAHKYLLQKEYFTPEAKKLAVLTKGSMGW